MLADFTVVQWTFTLLIFVWTGFVRTGLGFGGAALGLPLLLFVYDRPIYWIPVIGAHLLFFSGLTLRTRIHNVDWRYLRYSSRFIVPAALVGVMGLVRLPNDWLVIFIYIITLFYALTWVLDRALTSHNKWVDRLLLVTGGYVAGTSLTGAPFMVAVYMRNISKTQLRNTLFVLWFVLVMIKMSAFVILGVSLNLWDALLLLPVAAIGHVAGLKLHEFVLENDTSFKKITGGALILVCALGLWRMIN